MDFKDVERYLFVGLGGIASHNPNFLFAKSQIMKAAADAGDA
jgi:hypothetical protein